MGMIKLTIVRVELRMIYNCMEDEAVEVKNRDNTK